MQTKPISLQKDWQFTPTEAAKMPENITMVVKVIFKDTKSGEGVRVRKGHDD